jgi:hypothetical protein
VFFQEREVASINAYFVKKFLQPLFLKIICPDVSEIIVQTIIDVVYVITNQTPKRKS